MTKSNNNFNYRQSSDVLREQIRSTGVPDLAARILSSRDISSIDEIAPPMSDFPNDILPGVDKLCDILENSIKKNKKIRIMGDYDADGICGSSLAYICLRRLGADVSYAIPSRFNHGYGLHPLMVDEAANDGVSVLLTVDNGIAAVDGIKRAKELKMKVCITDHHEPPEVLPDADAMVNPRLPGGERGIALSGTGVIFYVLRQLNERFGGKVDMNSFLDLVAIATIADCMPMDYLNRILVGQGLKVIRENPCFGVKALVNRCYTTIKYRDISFFIAPKINSAGRFDKTDIAMDCLLAVDISDAESAVFELDKINDYRKKRVAEIVEEIDAMDVKSTGIVIGKSDWDVGLCGIIAGRLADKHKCPVFVFGKVNGEWRGSGRGPDGVDLYKLLNNTAEKTPDGIITKFGGHPRAAGITCTSWKGFSRVFLKECESINLEGLQNNIDVDSLPPVEEISIDAIKYMDKLAWGEGFEFPVFGGKFSTINKKLTQNGKHMTLELTNGKFTIPAIRFYCESMPDDIDVVFRLSHNKINDTVVAKIEYFS